MIANQQESTTDVAPGWREWGKIVVIAAGVLLVAFIAVLTLSTGSKPTVTWLPSASVMASGPPSKLAQAKARFISATALLWRPFRRSRGMIAIDVNILRLAESASVADFGMPVATNASGTKAWVLNADRLKQFVPPIGAVSGGTARMTMSDGGRGVIQMGNWATVIGTNDSVNVRLTFAPRVVSGSVQLEFGVDLGAVGSSATTNVVACLSRIPDGGALVVECSRAHDATGKHFWFVAMPRTWVPIRVTPAKAYTTTPRHAY